MVDFTYVNAALTRTGNEPITSFEDGTAEANIASENYERVVCAELGKYPWKFAHKTANLTALSGDPYDPWLYTYQLPTADMLLPSIVRRDGLPFEYAVMADRLLTNAGDGYSLVISYIWRAPESVWPPYFGELVTKRMEVIFLRALGERYEEAKAIKKEADQDFLHARLLDSQSQSPRDPRLFGTLAARRA